MAVLLALLVRQASFGRNRQLLAEIDEDLSRSGGAGADAPDAATLLDRARAREDGGTEAPPGPGRGVG